MDLISAAILDTSYDPNHLANTRLPFLQDEDNASWTEKERLLAASAQVVNSLEDFSQRMKEMYPEGCKSKSRPYLRIRSSSIPK